MNTPDWVFSGHMSAQRHPWQALRHPRWSLACRSSVLTSGLSRQRPSRVSQSTGLHAKNPDRLAHRNAVRTGTGTLRCESSTLRRAPQHTFRMGRVETVQTAEVDMLEVTPVVANPRHQNFALGPCASPSLGP